MGHPAPGIGCIVGKPGFDESSPRTHLRAPIDMVKDADIPSSRLPGIAVRALKGGHSMPIPADKVRALQLTFEGLLKLRQNDPEAFWEKLKGITSPREVELATIAVDNLTSNLKGAEGALRQLQKLT